MALKFLRKKKKKKAKKSKRKKRARKRTSKKTKAKKKTSKKKKRKVRAKKTAKRAKKKKRPARKGAKTKPKRTKVKKPKRKKKAPKKKAPKKEMKRVPEKKAYLTLKRYRIPVPPQKFVKSEKGLRRALKKLDFPLVMKVSGKSIMHRTEVGGIKVVSDEEKAHEAFKQLMKIKGVEKVLVQKKLSGIELIVGAKATPQFGHVVSVGMGGIYAEVLRDVTFRVVPLTRQDALAMVEELKGYEILAGAREHPPIDFKSLYDILVKVGRMAAKRKVKEMDINPLFCNEEGCWAADVRIVK